MTKISDRQRLFIEVEKEVRDARKAFPSTKLLGYAFVEESGEFVRAMLDYKQGKCGELVVYQEAVQCIAMAVRLLEEGCEELNLPSILDYEEIPDKYYEEGGESGKQEEVPRGTL